MRNIIFIVSLLFSCMCSAESFKSPAEAKAGIERIMAKVGAGDIEGGLGLLKPMSIIPAAEFDAMIGQAKLQIPGMALRFGKTIGSEYIGQSSVGSSLIRFTYIQKFEKHGMRWVFFLYKGSDGWVINTFAFDDKLYELFSAYPAGG